jgi:hypothetical protein
LNNWANLQGAVDYWRIGRDKYGSFDCDEALQEAETDPGVYSASVQVADGSYEVIIYSDRPGGLGRMPPK